MMAPATGFYATPGVGTRQVRIAYVLDVEQIRRAVDCLARALRTRSPLIVCPIFGA